MLLHNFVKVSPRPLTQLMCCLFHYRIPEEAPEHFSEPSSSTAQIALHPENGLWDQQQDLSWVRAAFLGWRLWIDLPRMGGRDTSCWCCFWCKDVLDQKVSWVHCAEAHREVNIVFNYVLTTAIYAIIYMTLLFCCCADMGMCSVDGSQDGSLSTWKLCLSMKCCTVSHSSCAYLLVTFLLCTRG